MHACKAEVVLRTTIAFTEVLDRGLGENGLLKFVSQLMGVEIVVVEMDDSGLVLLQQLFKPHLLIMIKLSRLFMVLMLASTVLNIQCLPLQPNHRCLNLL